MRTLKVLYYLDHHVDISSIEAEEIARLCNDHGVPRNIINIINLPDNRCAIAYSPSLVRQFSEEHRYNSEYPSPIPIRSDTPTPSAIYDASLLERMRPHLLHRLQNHRWDEVPRRTIPLSNPGDVYSIGNIRFSTSSRGTGEDNNG